jgi:hypothetical protein
LLRNTCKNNSHGFIEAVRNLIGETYTATQYRRSQYNRAVNFDGYNACRRVMERRPPRRADSVIRGSSIFFSTLLSGGELGVSPMRSQYLFHSFNIMFNNNMTDLLLLNVDLEQLTQT